MVADVPWNSRDKGTGNRNGRPQHQRSIPMLIIARSHLSPDGGRLARTASTAWQPMATIHRVARSHLSPVATCRQTVEALARTAPPLGSRGLPCPRFISSMAIELGALYAYG